MSKFNKWQAYWLTVIMHETAGVDTHSPNAVVLTGHTHLRGNLWAELLWLLDSPLYRKVNYLNKLVLKSVQACGESDQHNLKIF